MGRILTTSCLKDEVYIYCVPQTRAHSSLRRFSMFSVTTSSTAMIHKKRFYFVASSTLMKFNRQPLATALPQLTLT